MNGVLGSQKLKNFTSASLCVRTARRMDILFNFEVDAKGYRHVLVSGFCKELCVKAVVCPVAVASVFVQLVTSLVLSFIVWKSHTNVISLIIHAIPFCNLNTLVAVHNCWANQENPYVSYGIPIPSLRYKEKCGTM